MTNIKRLPGIKREEIRRLRSEKINTVDELWATIGENFENGVEKIEAMGIERDRVIELLAKQAEEESQSAGEPRLRRYWLEILLVLSLLGLLALTLRHALPS